VSERRTEIVEKRSLLDDILDQVVSEIESLAEEALEASCVPCHGLLGTLQHLADFGTDAFDTVAAEVCSILGVCESFSSMKLQILNYFASRWRTKEFVKALSLSKAPFSCQISTQYLPRDTQQTCSVLVSWDCVIRLRSCSIPSPFRHPNHQQAHLYRAQEERH
jgi:hypothetical protein